jgi:carbonic anhydrase/acetyltransferase-like protein (isoleucine patch superfamily)
MILTSALRLSASTFALLLVFAPLVRANPNVTVVAIDPPDRLTGTVLGDWNVAGNLEGWTTSNVNALAVASGALKGSAAGAAPLLHRNGLVNGPDLDLGFNDYLQIRLKLPAGSTGEVRFFYGTSTRPGFNHSRRFSIPSSSLIRDGAFHTYRLDLGLEVFWRDTLRDLRVGPMAAASGEFEVDYIEVGDVVGSAPTVNLNLNFKEGLHTGNTERLVGKHAVVWWDPANPALTLVQARRAVRMMEESFQVFCKKLGYNEPFRVQDSTTTPRYKVNAITWHGGFWMGGDDEKRGYLNVDESGLGDEGPGNPVPHEFAHVIQMHQPGRMVGGHWESHANYLQSARNFHFAAVIPNFATGISNLNGNSNYRPDHKRHIYADQRYYLALDDYGPALGLGSDVTARAWRFGERDRTLIEKLQAVVPPGSSVKDVAAGALKYWPMLDFVEKEKLRQQYWGTPDSRARFFWSQGSQLLPLPDRPGWWRVPLERAPDLWAYQMHELAASPGATVTVEVRGLDLVGPGEDWRWCLAALSAGDNVRYSPVWAPGEQRFTLQSGESKLFLIVAATPDQLAIDLENLSNSRPVDKHRDRLRYAYEVRLVGATPSTRPYEAPLPAEARPHPNGGGLVGPLATVAATAYVGPNARVLDSAQVLDSARILDQAVVRGEAVVAGSAVVSGRALVEGNARVEGQARVRDRANLVYGAVVRDRALVAGYTAVENTTVQDDAVVRGCAFPLAGGVVGGTAILDHDYSWLSSVSDGAHFSHVPWGDWWDTFYPQTLRKPRGLFASYRSEEPDGNLWWDEFGALHAVLRGSFARPFDSFFGSPVMEFNGTGAYAALDRSLVDTPAMSFACWVNPASQDSSAAPLLFLGHGASSFIRLERSANARAVLTVRNGTTTHSLTSTSLMGNGTWRHIAFSLSGTHAHLYVDGVLEASTATTLGPLDMLAPNDEQTPQANYLGRDAAGALFRGRFEDVRFYNVTITAAELRQEISRRGHTIALAAAVPANFDGTSTRAESGARNGRQRTLAAWVKPRASSASYQPIFDAGNEYEGGRGPGLGLDATGKWVAKLDGLPEVWSTGVAGTLNSWQHVALSFNGGTATLLVNGKPVASRAYPGPASDAEVTHKAFRIGYAHSNEAPDRPHVFNGELLLVRIHDRALSADELVLDADQDGVTDGTEIIVGTDPLNPASAPPRQPVSGLVATAAGQPIAGAQVVFLPVSGDLGPWPIRAITDEQGAYRQPLINAVWRVYAVAPGLNRSAEREVLVQNAPRLAQDFALTAYVTVSGRVTRHGDGAPLPGASITFSPESGFGESLTITADSTGRYSIALPDGLWRVTAGSTGVHAAARPIDLRGQPVNNIDFALRAQAFPRTADLLFSALAESFPGPAGSWPAYQPAGTLFTAMGAPTAETIDGIRWVRTLLESADGFRVATVDTPVPINGATIVVAVRPRRIGHDAPWTSVVDLFYDRLCLCVDNRTGTVGVIRNGMWFANPTGPVLPDGQSAVLTLVAQSTGTFQVFLNGIKLLDETSTSDLTELEPGVAGPYANAFNVGRNDPDGWSAFNGHIGDVLVYKVALSTAERQQVEGDLIARFVHTNRVVTASAGRGGVIHPLGTVPVLPGSIQTFSIAPAEGYVVSDVRVDGISQGPLRSFTFTALAANRTIEATFALSPFRQWCERNFGTSAGTPSIAGDVADPDTDGIPNLLEYALNGDPLAPSPGILPQLTSETDGLVLRFSRIPEHGDLRLTVQASTSLHGAWIDIATSQGGLPFVAVQTGITVSESVGGATRGVILRDTREPEPSGRRFYRVSASRQ